VVRTPVCYFCAKTGVLCATCQDRLDRGEISDIDIEVSKWFIELENSIPQLKDCTVHKAVLGDGLLVILVSCSRGGSSKVLWNRVSKVLSERKKGVNVRVVEKTSSIKKLVEQIVAPVRVIGANTIWLPDGSWESTLKIPRSEVKRLPAEPRVIEQIVKEISGEVVKLVAV